MRAPDLAESWFPSGVRILLELLSVYSVEAFKKQQKTIYFN